MRTKREVAFLTAVGLGLMGVAPGCREQQPASDRPLPRNAVAMVADQVISLETFQQEMARRAGSTPGKYHGLDEKVALLEELIRFEVIHQKARAAGYDQDPRIVASLKRTMVARYQEDQAARLGAPTVTAAEITGYYQLHLDHFGTPARVRAALIEIKVSRTATSEHRTRISQRAEAVLAEAKTNVFPDHTFGLLAQRHSEHQPSRYRGGDIGWLTVGDTNSGWAPALLGAIFKLSQPGEFSPVIETPGAFYVVKLIESQPAEVRPLEEVKAGIEYSLLREKAQQQQEQLYAAFRQGVPVWTNLALLESVPAPAPEPLPPRVPGATTGPGVKPRQGSKP